MKFRKKPVIIEAVQWTGENSEAILYWVGGYHKSDSLERIAYLDKDHQLKIRTLEGEHLANVNDWIIKGVHNEFYPCKPDIFEKTYEAVEDTELV